MIVVRKYTFDGRDDSFVRRQVECSLALLVLSKDIYPTAHLLHLILNGRESSRLGKQKYQPLRHCRRAMCRSEMQRCISRGADRLLQDGQLLVCGQAGETDLGPLGLI